MIKGDFKMYYYYYKDDVPLKKKDNSRKGGKDDCPYCSKDFDYSKLSIPCSCPTCRQAQADEREGGRWSNHGFEGERNGRGNSGNNQGFYGEYEFPMNDDGPHTFELEFDEDFRPQHFSGNKFEGPFRDDYRDYGSDYYAYGRPDWGKDKKNDKSDPNLKLYLNINICKKCGKCSCDVKPFPPHKCKEPCEFCGCEPCRCDVKPCPPPPPPHPPLPPCDKRPIDCCPEPVCCDDSVGPPPPHGNFCHCCGSEPCRCNRFPGYPEMESEHFDYYWDEQ
ncbi:MAG TPA: hypothetical protein PLK57_01855 [Clostridiales bacterium]|nr:hypothetical protein [Clostridiales bacterium]